MDIQHSVQPKRDIDNSLVRISLHQAQNQFIVNVPEVIQLRHSSTCHLIPIQILDQYSLLFHDYS
jgi:hypothetical protein